MSERENIFTRIREALTVEAHAHHGTGLPTHGRSSPRDAAGRRDDGRTVRAVCQERQRTARDVQAGQGRQRTDRRVARVARHGKVAARGDAHGASWRRRRPQALGLPTLVTDDGYDKHELEQCDVGISECDALIAQTGTVLVTSQTAAGGRCPVCRRITSSSPAASNWCRICRRRSRSSSRSTARIIRA